MKKKEESKEIERVRENKGERKKWDYRNKQEEEESKKREKE